MHVQVAVGYGGRQEIADALRALLEARQERGDTLEQVIADLHVDEISEHLYTTGTP
jgi:short-chain Z-isoprenyl diphosphate synthase